MDSNLVYMASMEYAEQEPQKMTLIDQLPTYFRPVLEFQQLMIAHGWAYDLAESTAGLVLNNFFLQTCDEDTIAQYEKLFGIIPEAGDTMEYRRERILQIFSSVAPFDINYLDDRLRELFGGEYALTVYPGESRLIVNLTSEKYGAVALLYNLLLDVVPAHVEIISNQQVVNYINRPLYAGAVPGSAIHQYI